MTKTCGKCKEEKPLTDFNKDRNTPSGLKSSCRKCANEMSRVWRENNPDKMKAAKQRWNDNNKERIREVHQAWKEENRDRVRYLHKTWREANPYKKRFWDNRAKARRFGVEHYSETEDWILERYEEIYNSPCNACGSTENIQLDHIIPWDRGGNDLADNWQPLCRFCNMSKRNKLMEEWKRSA